MAGKDQESMMQSKLAAAHYLPLIHNEIVPLVVTEKSNETDLTINQSSSLTESFVNDRYDEESDCSDWENEDDIDFERSAFDTFIIDDE